MSNTNAKLYKEPCDKCNGTSVVSWARHVQNGVCFRCKGTGCFTYKTSPEARAKAREKAQEKREATRLLAVNKMRDDNEADGFGHVTDYERDELRRIEEAHGVAILMNDRADALAHYASDIADGKGGFCDEMAASLRAGKEIYGRALAITMEVLAKNISGSRKNSRAYSAAFESIETAFFDQYPE